MTYPEAIQYLDSFINYEKISAYDYSQSLKFERIKRFLNTLDNPQLDFNAIHIAGTKGKGSTCAFIAYILRQAQYKVGLYTSPHLSDFRERIRILSPQPISYTPQLNRDFEGIISEEELTALIQRLRPDIEQFNSKSEYGALSFFEVYTAIAFKCFQERKVDFAVLETGLGGRLDATNTVNPLVAAITPISYEHTRQLGKTLTEIGNEKAGIIKQSIDPSARSIVITAPQEEEAIKVIRDRCKQEGAVLYEIGRDIVFNRQQSCGGTQCFNIDGVLGRLTNLKIKLVGRHQVINAALAAAVILALNKFYQGRKSFIKDTSASKEGGNLSAGVDIEEIREGLYNTAWPGRFEVISEHPLIILDGAQNIASAQTLKEAIIDNFPGRRIILILGVSDDKDIQGISEALIPISDEVILTQADNPRAADVEVMEKIISPQLSVAGCRMHKTRGVKEAMQLAKDKAGVEDLVLVTGSLFLVGEARASLMAKKAISR